MNKKYLKMFLNIVAIIICFIISYIVSVFSIFYFWGKHADKKMNNELLITIGIYAIFFFIIVIMVYCIRNIWKIFRNKS